MDTDALVFLNAPQRTGLRKVEVIRRALHFVLLMATATVFGLHSRGQTATNQMPPEGQTPANPAAASNANPLPESGALLRDVERNEERMDALRNDYTYHVHLEQERLRKDGSVTETEVTDSESLTIDGVRVDRVVARNGKPLDADEGAKENDRLDKQVARAKERRAKAAADGQKTDSRGDPLITVARLLELGSFSNERRVVYGGRPTIVLEYAGDPQAKTRSAPEAAVKDLVGTVWIDEGDRVLVRGEGHFLNDFKIGGGLIANVHKNTSFEFEAAHVNDAVWLPAKIHGQGSVRVLLVTGFDGQLRLVTSDYRRFHTSSRIVPGPTAEAGSSPPSASAPGPNEPNDAGHKP